MKEGGHFLEVLEEEQKGKESEEVRDYENNAYITGSDIN